LLSLTEVSFSNFLYTIVSVTEFRQSEKSAQRSACSCVSNDSRKHTNVEDTQIKTWMKEINVKKHQSRKVSNVKTWSVKVWKHEKAFSQLENFEFQQIK